MSRDTQRSAAERPEDGTPGEPRDELASTEAEAEERVRLEGASQDRADFAAEVLERLAGRAPTHQRYALKGEIARGGQGAVLRVWDEDLRRNLAMKVVLGKGDTSGATPATDSRVLRRFLEEAHVTGQLDHPGIVPVHELGVDAQGRVYFTMKLVKGRDLKAVLHSVREGLDGWTRTRALNVLLKVCEAMDYAHSKGVIHRDLKPANVMVGRYGEVFVMDWGLARVVGREDEKDIRLRDPQAPTTVALRPPRLQRDGSSEEPLVTMDGDVIGTPAYMSPEQAAGDLARMGPHSDVYSVGAMLYHLLAGEAPYVTPGARQGNREILLRLHHVPPRPLHEVVPDVPPELLAICEKAMARDTSARYEHMHELAEDLRAYLEGRVVRAYETGAVAELRKWVRRNTGFAAAIAVGLVLLLAGLSASLVLKGRSDRNALLAAEREREALSQEAIARRERGNVLRLSAFQQLEDLEREARELWPPWPENLARYEAWLASARELVAGLDPAPGRGDVGHRQRLAELRQRAPPRGAAEREADRRAHPRHGELESARARLAALERAQAVRAGRARPEVVELSAEESDASADALAALAWPLVDPDRTRFGEEARGLALARAALERATSDEEYLRVLRALVWALHANGLDDQATSELETARSIAPAQASQELERSRARLTQALEAVRAGAAQRRVDALRSEVVALAEQVDGHRVWSFAQEEERWWHAQLEKLVAAIEAFAEPTRGLMAGLTAEHGWGIERRRDWAAAVEQLTVSGPEASRRWGEALATIADRARSPAYAGLELRPQVGLIPLGPDPDSGLFEFAHPLSGTIPERDGAGRLVLAEHTGLVFVLLPGGTFAMGAQSVDAGAPNFDPQARLQEGPVHEVTLSPFLLSKFEMTQAQWLRLTGSNPSFHQPPERASSLLHPVEQVSWSECVLQLERMGLRLPSEAQWEYAARGGTTSTWWTGDDRETLRGAVNLADRSVDRAGIPWTSREEWPELDDGYTFHAPVGTYRANPFGLHDVLGNVWEWCQDGFDADFYASSSGRDPVCPPQSSPSRATRGGSFYNPPSAVRSSYRNSPAPDYRVNLQGVRPARTLRP